MRYIQRLSMDCCNCGTKDNNNKRKKRQSIDDHQYVEIGGLKWSIMNIGASKELEDGLYFAWGETEGYGRRGKDPSKYAASNSSSNNWSNYKFYDSETGTTTKYNAEDKKTKLDLEDDAAHIIWGGKWRMPTKAEVTPLLSKSKWTNNYEGRAGFLYDDEKGNQLFFPASTNTINPGGNYYNKQGCYWTSTRTNTTGAGAQHLHIGGSNTFYDSGFYGGFTIRPVWDDSLPELDRYNGFQYVDLGLPSGTLWASRNIGSIRETAYGNYYMYGAGSKPHSESNGTYRGTENPLNEEKDTASQLWDGDWHTPTKEQFEELFNNTTVEWVEEKQYSAAAVKGIRFTAQNGNSIFLPACGTVDGDQETKLGYWTSTPIDSNDAYSILIDEEDIEGENITSASGRRSGLCIRPVIDKEISGLWSYEYESGKFITGRYDNNGVYINSQPDTELLWENNSEGIIIDIVGMHSYMEEEVLDAINEKYGTNFISWNQEFHDWEVDDTLPDWNAYEKIEIPIRRIAANMASAPQEAAYIVGQIDGDTFKIMVDTFAGIITNDNGLITSHNGPTEDAATYIKNILSNFGIEVSNVQNELVDYEVNDYIPNWDKFEIFT